MNIKKRVIIPIIVFLLLMVTFLSGCEDTDTGTVVIISIQDAIDKSASGDIINVPNGIYNETIFINKSITISGENSVNTIINANKSGNVVNINANNVKIMGFTIHNSGQGTGSNAGIYIKKRSNISIINNIIRDNFYGIRIEGESNNNNIFYNDIVNNDEGISASFSSNNNITSNNVSSSSVYGIYIEGSSDKNVITRNNYSENSYGLRVKGSRNNDIHHNIFISNQRGLYFCCGATSNYAYLNNFFYNSVWNADDRFHNYWFKEGVGNYWDDYTGVDVDLNGIGDIPYNISDAVNQDDFPLMSPITI